MLNFFLVDVLLYTTNTQKWSYGTYLLVVGTYLSPTSLAENFLDMFSPKSESTDMYKAASISSAPLHSRIFFRFITSYNNPVRESL